MIKIISGYQMKHKSIITGLLISALTLNTSLKAQDIASFRLYEDTLSALCNKFWKMKDDSSKLAANTVFLRKYQSVLSLPPAFNYPFDSLSGISKLRSDDSKLRITTWNVPLKNGTFRYFGFVEVNDGHIFILQESADRPLGWENKILTSENWYGAVYYKLISLKFNNQEYYTLLGWDGNNNNSNLKIIDILTFDSSGIPCFGKAIFKTAEGIKNRIVIEYAEKANILLRYDYQSIMIQKGSRIKEKKSWMIVTDRLVPMMPTMEGIRKFYVPSGDMYDAYLFDKGFWTFVENVAVSSTIP